MDERTSGAVRAALREVADGAAGPGGGSVDAVVAGAVRRGRARLRRRRLLARAGAALALVTGGGLVVTQLPVGPVSQGEAASAGAGGGGDSAASATPGSADQGAREDAAAPTGESAAALEAAPAGGFTALRVGDGSVAVLQRPPSGPSVSAAAIVAGTLAVLDGGCLGFRDDDGTQTAVVWPSGTTALADGVGVAVPGMGAYRVGDAVEGGGGYGDAVFEGPLAGCPSAEVAYLDEDQVP